MKEDKHNSRYFMLLSEEANWVKGFGFSFVILNLDINTVIIGDPERLEINGLGEFGLIYSSEVSQLGFLIPGR